MLAAALAACCLIAAVEAATDPVFTVKAIDTRAAYHSWLNNSVILGPGCTLSQDNRASDPHQTFTLQTAASGLRAGDLIMAVPRASIISSE